MFQVAFVLSAEHNQLCNVQGPEKNENARPHYRKYYIFQSIDNDVLNKVQGPSMDPCATVHVTCLGIQHV